MTKYKVGDVAALFSKPKSPTTTGGKKLQSLFEDYYSKKDRSTSNTQEGNSAVNRNLEMNDKSTLKRSRKRKFSSSNDSELNISLKKFKGPSEQESGSINNVNKKQKKLKNKKNFLRKDTNNFKLNSNLFSKKLKESFEEKDSIFIEDKKVKTQQDFPRKKKKSKENLFNPSSVFPKFEVENDVELSSAQNMQKDGNKNFQKDNKQNKNFIKKSKKKQNFYHNNSNLSNDISFKESNDNNDTSLKEEVKEFLYSNSIKKEMERNNDNMKKGKNIWKEQDALEKPKKKSFPNKNLSLSKNEPSPEQNSKSKKKSEKDNCNQQNFSRTKLEAASFHFGKTEFELKDAVEQYTLLKKPNSLAEGDIKKSKKSKHMLNVTSVNDSLASESNSKINAPKTKETLDFIRKPKRKSENETFGNNIFKKSNSKISDNMNRGENIRNEKLNFNNKMQKEQGKEFKVDAPDFIKLPNLDEDNEKSREERLSKTLFVGNLPKNISKHELRNLFTTFGTVESVRLPGIETDKAKIFGKNPPKLLHSNYASDTIHGFVVFKEKQSAVEAVKLSGSVFKDHHITVDFALPPGTHKLYDNKRSIFIGNLPFDVKDESIWNAFSQCGRIEGVRVVRDRQTGLGKGFGYVLFSTVEAKQNALTLENLNIEGREIRIKTVDSDKKVQKANASPSRKNTFKSRAIRMKKKVTSGHKSVRKLTNKQKLLHKKKKTAEILQKAMK